MTFEEFNDLASGIQSIIVSIGVLSAGIWALFRFNAFKEAKKARAELDKLNHELTQRGIIKLSTNHSVLNSEGNRYLAIVLVVENTGNKEEVLDFSKPQVTLSKCNWNSLGEIEYSNVQQLRSAGETGYVTDALIRPGQISSFSYISGEVENGIYSIEVDIIASPDSVSEHFIIPGERTSITWSCAKYIEVSA